MSRTVNIVSLLSLLPVNCFNPSTINYCKLKCPQSQTISSACKCNATGSREEVATFMHDFRRQILDFHNEYRNRIARGDGIYENYPPAANMMALNYDLELEHVARCYAISTFSTGHDECRMVSYCTNGQPSQNLYSRRAKHKNLYFLETAVKSWYNEMKDVPNKLRMTFITKPDHHKLSSVANFASLIWARSIRLGCARVWNPENSDPDWKFTLVCNYAGPDSMCQRINESLYKPGPPCSNCGDFKCNNLTKTGKYDALCGEVQTDIIVAPSTMAPSQTSSNGNVITSIVITTVTFIVNFIGYKNSL